MAILKTIPLKDQNKYLGIIINDSLVILNHLFDTINSAVQIIFFPKSFLQLANYYPIYRFSYCMEV